MLYHTLRLERNGYAMGNAARFFKSVVLPRMFQAKNAIRSRPCWAAITRAENI